MVEFSPLHDSVRRLDKTATSTTTPKGKYTESLTFSTPNCICANYGKLVKPSLVQFQSIWLVTHHRQPCQNQNVVNVMGHKRA